MSIRPFNRGKEHLRLGLKMSPGAWGWALTGTRCQVGEEGVAGDPAHAALAVAEARGVRQIDLYRYLTDDRFEKSHAAADGLTREEHCLLVERTRALLTANGFFVTVKDVP